MKRIKKTICAIVAIVGITAAGCVADGSAYEIEIRMAGVAMLAVGCWCGGFFYFQEDKENGKEADHEG